MRPSILTLSSCCPPPFLLPFYQLYSQPLFTRAHRCISIFQITTYEFSPHPQRSTDSAMPSSRLAGTSHVELSPSVHSSPALTVSALQIVPAPFPPLVCNTLPIPFRSLARLIRHRLSPAGQFPQLRARTPAHTLDLDHIRHRSASGPPRCVYTMYDGCDFAGVARLATGMNH